jgi:hypothetical protein
VLIGIVGADAFEHEPVIFQDPTRLPPHAPMLQLPLPELPPPLLHPRSVVATASRAHRDIMQTSIA